MQIVTDWPGAVACAALLLSPPAEAQISLAVRRTGAERRGGEEGDSDAKFARFQGEVGNFHWYRFNMGGFAVITLRPLGFCEVLQQPELKKVDSV